VSGYERWTYRSGGRPKILAASPLYVEYVTSPSNLDFRGFVEHPFGADAPSMRLEEDAGPELPYGAVGSSTLRTNW
jgi:hypothetical protein